MIAAFIAETMTRYLAEGRDAESAAQFAINRLADVYGAPSGNTLYGSPPEALDMKTALTKGYAAIDTFMRARGAFGHYSEGMEALSYMAGQGIKITPCIKKSDGSYSFRYAYRDEYAKLQTLNPQAKISDTSHFTADIEQIKKHRADGIEMFRFIPADYGLFCLDIDAKEGKENGLKELLKVFDPETLPDELRDIEKNFPCYVKTPSNGYHLYFKYSGSPIKGTALFPGIETKHGSPGLNAPGSYKNGKPYILYGALEKAPPLFGLFLAKIKKQGLLIQETPRPEKAATDRAASPKPAAQTRTPKAKTTLDDLAAETSGGNHDRQVSFAGKVCRYQLAVKKHGRDYSAYTMSAALAYVKSRPDIFGAGADTENTIKSLFRDNGGE